MIEESLPFVKADTYVKRFVKCPSCKNATEGFYADYYLSKIEPPANAYLINSWRCERCKDPFAIRLHIDGTVEIAPVPQGVRESPWVKSFILLKSTHKENPIYVVLNDGAPEDFIERDIADPEDSPLKFLYNEHMCPENWVPHVLRFIFEGSADPHGVFEFVRAIPHKEAISFAFAHPGNFDLKELKSIGDDKVNIGKYFERYLPRLFPETIIK